MTGRRSNQARALALVALAATGCALSTSVTGGVVLDQRGETGGEGRLMLEGATGTPELRARAGLGGGGGQHAALGGFGTLAVEAAVALGGETTWELALPAAARFTDDGVVLGGGLAGAVLFQISDGPERGGVALGPRVSVESAIPSDGGDGRALFQAGLVLRWTGLDTIPNAWH